MSYPMGLDEYTTERLQKEIDERKARHNSGLCTYCERPHGKLPACKFPERHNGSEV